MPATPLADLVAYADEFLRMQGTGNIEVLVGLGEGRNPGWGPDDDPQENDARHMPPAKERFHHVPASE
jgi:hypothetical protein